jgi:hypothetical protein
VQPSPLTAGREFIGQSVGPYFFPPTLLPLLLPELLLPPAELLLEPPLDDDDDEEAFLLAAFAALVANLDWKQLRMMAYINTALGNTSTYILAFSSDPRRGTVVHLLAAHLDVR